VAQVNKFGEVSILTKTEIEDQKKLLREQNVEIKDNKKIIEKLSKIQQKGGELTEEQRKDLVDANKKVIETTEKRSKTLETLNLTEADDTRSFRDKFDDTIDTYVPDGLRDIGSAFTEGLTAPFTAIKELGTGFMGMLKPLKLLPKMLMMFSTGVISAVISLAPFIGIAAAVVVGIIALVAAFMYVRKNFDDIREKLSDFGDAVMEIPGKIADFFTSIFTKIKNFFIDAINGVIGLLNKIPGVEIEKIEKAVDPNTLDTTTSGDQDAAFTAGNLSDTTSAIEQQDNAFLVPPTTGDEDGGFFSKFKNMFKSKPNNNQYLPVDTSAASSNAIIDNSVKTVNQNNQNQNLGITSRNDDLSLFRTNDAYN